jgi:uncharacterized protein (PEP-CTERM system associated)
VEGGTAFDTRELLLGFQGSLGQRGRLEVTGGQVSWDFEDPAEEDFSGLQVDLRYRYQLRDRMSLTTGLSRYPLQSFFNVNNYYTSSSIDLKLTHEPGSRISYAVTLVRRRNEYPEEIENLGVFTGTIRTDSIARAELSFTYKIRDSLRAELRYRHEDRDSNVDFAEYTANRVTMQLSFGLY